MISPIERVQLYEKAKRGRMEQLQDVHSALLKLQMMGLTLQSGLVECPPPANIYPPRWKAMLSHVIVNEGEI